MTNTMVKMQGGITVDVFMGRWPIRLYPKDLRVLREHEQSDEWYEAIAEKLLKSAKKQVAESVKMAIAHAVRANPDACDRRPSKLRKVGGAS